MAVTWAHTAWFWCWHWYIDHGVPGNLAASVIAFLAGYFAGLRRHLRRLGVVHGLVVESHRLLHHVHAEKATELGHNIPE